MQTNGIFNQQKMKRDPQVPVAVTHEKHRTIAANWRVTAENSTAGFCSFVSIL